MNWKQITNPALRSKFAAIAALPEAELNSLGLIPRHRDDFLKYVRVSDREHDCWRWKGGVTKNSRKPRCIIWDSVKKTNMYAYRVSFALFNRIPMSELKVVRHLCPDEEDPSCCNPLHLRNGTTAENNRDMVAYGTSAKGDRNGSRKHPESRPRGMNHKRTIIRDPKIVQTIRATWDAAVSRQGLIAALARYYGVPDNLVSRIVRRRGYTEILDDPTIPPIATLDIRRPEDRRGDMNGHSRIPDMALSLFYGLYHCNLTDEDRQSLVCFVAKRYGTNKYYIRDIGRRKFRRWLTEPLDAFIDPVRKVVITAEFLEETFAKCPPLREGAQK